MVKNMSTETPRSLFDAVVTCPELADASQFLAIALKTQSIAGTVSYGGQVAFQALSGQAEESFLAVASVLGRMLADLFGRDRGGAMWMAMNLAGLDALQQQVAHRSDSHD